MKILFNIINRFISTKPKPPMYGRWHLDYERSIQDRKVYLTNMDNCGCCGNIIEEIKNDESKTYTDEELIPYFF